MATTDKATDSKTSVNRTAQVGTSDTTINDITAAATKVGAPTTARVTTGAGFNLTADDGTVYNYSVTFSWTDEV